MLLQAASGKYSQQLAAKIQQSEQLLLAHHGSHPPQMTWWQQQQQNYNPQHTMNHWEGGQHFGMGRNTGRNRALRAQQNYTVQQAVDQALKKAGVVPSNTPNSPSTIWTCGMCQTPHHNPKLKKCRFCHAPRGPQDSAPPSATPAPLPSAALATSHLQNPAFVQKMTQHVGPVLESPSTPMEVEAPHTPTTTPLAPPSSTFTDFAALHLQAQEAFAMLSSKFGADSCVAKDAQKRMQETEKKITGVGLAKHTVTVEQQVLSLEKEKASLLDTFNAWEAQQQLTISTKLKEVEDLKELVQKENISQQAHVARIETNIQHLRQSAMHLKTEASPPPPPTPVETATLPPELTFSHVTPLLLSQVGNMVNAFVMKAGQNRQVQRRIGRN